MNRPPSTRFREQSPVQLLRTLSEREQKPLSAATYYSKACDLSHPPSHAYLTALQEARQQILCRLVGGLLRDCLEALPTPAFVELDGRSLSDDERRAAGEIDVSSVVADIELSPHATRLGVLQFPASDLIVIAPIEATFGFARYTFVPPFWKWTSSTTKELTHPEELIRFLDRDGVFPSAHHRDRFTREIHQSCANLALAQLAKARFERNGSTVRCDSPTWPPTEGVEAADQFARFERLVTDGHPFHPGAKIRDGMTPTDSLLYAPEFTASLGVRFVAVHSDAALRTTGPFQDPLTEYLTTHIPELAASLEAALPASAIGDDYAVVPVHPWQYTNTIAPRTDSGRHDDGETIVPLPDCTVRATPLLSHRTVVPYADETNERHPDHLKLSINVRLTNTVRTLAPESVYNGPRLSRILREIVSREAFDRFGILAERAAASYYPHESLQSVDSDLAEQIAALRRQNPYDHRLVDADKGEPITVASLLADSPVTKQPIVCELIDEFARQTDSTSPADTAHHFFEAYCRAVVPGPLTLLSKYGVALEAHPQNTCLVVKDGLPRASLARDFAGIRVHPDRLSMQGHTVTPYPDSMVVTSDIEALYNKLYYALFQNHLTELIVVLCNHTALDEATCWEVVQSQCRDVFASLRADDAVPAAWLDQDETALFAEQMAHKALTAMRLRGKTYDYIMRPVPNPLTR